MFYDNITNKDIPAWLTEALRWCHAKITIKPDGAMKIINTDCAEPERTIVEIVLDRSQLPNPNGKIRLEGPKDYQWSMEEPTITNSITEE